MIGWLRLLPAWVWWVLVVMVVAGGQQWRIGSLRSDLQASETESRKAAERLAACRVTRTNLLAQVSDQNDALAGLRAAEQKRQQTAHLAQTGARQQAEQDYLAANRLQQAHTGGDACAAAAAVIDEELGL